MKKFPKLMTLIILGIGSFLFFFYFSFPFEVLKEAIAVRASQATGMSIEIGNMRPSFPIGLSIDKLSIANPSGNSIKFAKVDAKVSLLRFFLGKLGVNLLLEDEKSGYLEVFTSFNLFSLIQGNVSAPSAFVMEAKKFKIDDIFNFVLKDKAQSPDTSVLIKPLFEAFKVEGKLDANVDFSIDSIEPVNSEGEGQLAFSEMVLLITDSNMTIPNQAFDKALVKANLKDGQLRFDQSSGIVSKDIEITIGGQITQRPEVKLDLIIGIQLRDALKNQFGWALDAAANKPTDGKLDIHIGGPLNQGPKIKIL